MLLCRQDSVDHGMKKKEIFVTDFDSPVSAMACLGCFVFYAGVPDKELVR